MNKIMVLDTETTVVDPRRHAITQIAGMVVVDGQVRDEFDIRVRPFDGAEITAEALAVTGLTEADLFAEGRVSYRNGIAECGLQVRGQVQQGRQALVPGLQRRVRRRDDPGHVEPLR